MVIMIMLEVYMCKNVMLCVSVSTIKLLKKYRSASFFIVYMVLSFSIMCVSFQYRFFSMQKQGAKCQHIP